MTKRIIFSQLHKLLNNESLSTLSMNHDMTKEERVKTKLLVEEAKRQTKDLWRDIKKLGFQNHRQHLNTKYNKYMYTPDTNISPKKKADQLSKYPRKKGGDWFY